MNFEEGEGRKYKVSAVVQIMDCRNERKKRHPHQLLFDFPF
jgi:hypothetical protein